MHTVILMSLLVGQPPQSDIEKVLERQGLIIAQMQQQIDQQSKLIEQMADLFEKSQQQKAVSGPGMRINQHGSHDVELSQRGDVVMMDYKGHKVWTDSYYVSDGRGGYRLIWAKGRPVIQSGLLFGESPPVTQPTPQLRRRVEVFRGSSGTQE